MAWLPENWDVLSIGAVVVATLGGVIGIAAGVQGMTATASARRLISWTTEALAHENAPGQTAILSAMRVRAEARLLALHWVRWWRFLETPVFLFLYAPILIVAFGDRNGWFRIASSVTLTAVTLQAPIRRALRTYCERVRIERLYAAGATVVSPPELGMLALMEGGTRREWTLAVLGATELTALMVGIALLISDRAPGIAFILVIASAIAIWQSLGAINGYARRLVTGTAN